MQILQQIWKKVYRLIKYILIYFVFAFFIINCFAAVYHELGESSPYLISGNIFWGISVPESIPRNLYIAQIAVQNIFFIAWVGSSLSKFLKPLNPFFFSKYVVYHNEQIKFRYWIMLPAHKFLYNIHIRIYLSDGPLYNGGVNKLQAKWEWNSKFQNIDLARGVHIVALSEKDSTELDTKLSECSTEAKLVIMIHGNTDEGLAFWGRHSYNVNKFFKIGYDYVPVRHYECAEIVNSTGVFYPISPNRFLIRYHNFDKIYQPNISALYFCQTPQIYKPFEERNNNCVFTYGQIGYGKYKANLRQWLLDIIDLLISLYLDKNAQYDFEKKRVKGADKSRLYYILRSFLSRLHRYIKKQWI